MTFWDIPNHKFRKHFIDFPGRKICEKTYTRRNRLRIADIQFQVKTADQNNQEQINEISNIQITYKNWKWKIQTRLLWPPSLLKNVNVNGYLQCDHSMGPVGNQETNPRVGRNAPTASNERRSLNWTLFAFAANSGHLTALAVDHILAPESHIAAKVQLKSMWPILTKCRCVRPPTVRTS